MRSKSITFNAYSAEDGRSNCPNRRASKRACVWGNFKSFGSSVDDESKQLKNIAWFVHVINVNPLTLGAGNHAVLERRYIKR